MHRTALAIILLLFAALLGLGGVSLQLSRVKQPKQQINPKEKEAEVGSVEAEWLSGGQLVKFKSTRQDGETAAAWGARARAEYDALREAFPPDSDK